MKNTPFVHQDKGIRPAKAAVSALLELLLVCVYRKSGVLSLYTQCPYTVPEPSLFFLSLNWAEAPARTLLGHDAIQLLFATCDGFLEECSAFINCSLTESQTTQKPFPYLALLWSGNFYNKGEIINPHQELL